MSDRGFDVGHYRIHKALLKSDQNKDIGEFIVTLSFSESIVSSTLIGKIGIADTFDFIHRMPLRGEEVIELQYSDFYENKIEQTFYIDGVDSIAPADKAQGIGIGYYINIYSPQVLLSTTQQIRKSYTGTMSETATKIFNEYLTNETFKTTLETENSEGIQTIIIPKLSPIDAINFCARRSYSSTHKSSNFYFFATRKDFKYKTHEKMIEDARKKGNTIEYIYNPGLNTDLNNKEKSMRSIQEISFSKMNSTISEISSGAILNDIVEVDIIKKQYKHNIYNHSKKIDDYVHLDRPYQKELHSPKFIEQYFKDENAIKSSMVLTDFERDNQNYKDIIGPKTSIQYYTNMINCNIKIYGRNDINCGDTIRLNLPRFINQQRLLDGHKSLSGYWTIHTINHNFNQKDYICNVLLMKDTFNDNQTTWT